MTLTTGTLTALTVYSLSERKGAVVTNTYHYEKVIRFT